MKKIIILILLFTSYSVSISAQVSTACCPEFVLKFKRDADCLKNGPCASAAIPNGENSFTASMCKYSTNTFIVTPNLPGYTYAWTVSGGVFSPSGLTTSTTNPSTITWGGNGTGTITVTITSADGKCVKTIKEVVCLRDAPKALFSFTPNNACAGTLINFSNISTGGVAVSWDFGDGTFAGNVNNPTHTYATSGTYNVTITVYSDTTDCRPSSAQPGDGQPPRPCCGCISTYTLPVTVIAGNPLSIVPKDCINQCLCPGDTAEYCASKICAPYNWTVTGGTIISGAGTSCIKVVWGNTYPTSIQLVQPGCGNPCNDTSRLSVPVLVSGIPIMPNVGTVCQFSTQTYSLPAMPGAFYNWSVTGGTIVGSNQNTPTITVSWGAGPTGQVNCSYNNPLKPGCDGTTSLNVSIKPILKINGPTQTCEGCGITLFTGGLPVTWTGPTGVSFTPSVGSATLVNFPITGVMSTYTITATSSAFCNSPQTHTVVVAPKPVLSITPSTVQTCPNTPIKFVATSTVSTGNISWPLPPGATMVANTGPQLDTAVIQFATLPATVTAEQLCAFNLNCSKGTATATVTKPPLPIITPSVSNPCIDQTVNYTVSNAVPGVVYTWAISSTLGTITSGQGTSSVQILWHGGSPNTATLTVSNCAGTSVAVPVTVTLPQFPTISVSGTCIKNGMALTSSTAGPYLWSGPGVTGQTTATVNINQPGTYTVTINAGGAGSCAQTKSITIPPNPYWVKIIPPCSVASCNPNSLSVLLTVATNIGAPINCQWMFDAAGGSVVFTPISTSCGNYTATALGSYYLIMTDANGCKDTSNIIRIPQDINICCTTPVCSALSGVNFNFTHSGCQPTVFTGSPLVLPSGWTVGTIHPTICYGDGTSDDFVSLNTTHQYAAAGVYTACVVQKVVRTATNDTCCIISCKQVTIPVVTKFTAAFNCNTGLLTMNDASSYYPSAAGAVYSWTVTGGTYTGTLTNGPNQTITPTSSGTFNITLSITLNGCLSTYSVGVIVVLPVAPITATPNPSCDGSPVFFSTTPGMSCYWQFGDGKFSYAASPQHIYAGPGSYTVTLTATTPDGCVITTTKVVVIQPKPIVTLTPKNSTVCPGTSVTLTASINANGNTMCPTLASYTFQWYRDGVAYGSPTNSSTLTTTQYGNYYAVLTSTAAGCNCVITTDTAQIKWFPKPIAKIKGKSSVCLAFGSGTIALSNIVGTYSTYNWSSNNPGGISFSPLNAAATTATITTPGNYQIFLEVIDANGCKAYDTLCIYATNSPTAFVTPPGGTLCAGNAYSLTATPTPLTAPPAGYNYLWNNNASTQTINASAAGVYYAVVTDMNTGCSALTNSIVINKGPDLSLFPSCCDTICSDKPINISVPLPLAPGENICTKYTIVWLDNNVPISPQPSPCNILNTATLTPLLGMHNISIAVTLNGCTDTSNVFNLYIKDCGCDCKGSHWGDIILTEGEGKLKGDPIRTRDVKLGTKNKTNVPTGGIKLECKQTYVLKCNQPFTINANYICKDTTCPSQVTYVLTPPTGPVITGNAPLTYTPTVSGTYTVMLYGWCNGIKCDSCLITFKVECKDPPKDCCKGSHWGEGPWYFFSNWETRKKLDCAKEQTILVNGKNCKDSLIFTAGINCPTNCSGDVKIELYDNANNLVFSGNTLLNVGTLPNGTYTVVFNGYCGGVLCLTCKAKIIVDCKPEPPCDCKGSKWGDKTVTIGNTTQPFTCFKYYEKIKCNTPITVNANYLCADPSCAGTVTYSLTQPSGTTTGTLPVTFNLSQSGMSWISIIGYCGGVACDTCTIRFMVDKCDSVPCCPYEIKVTPKEVTYTSNPTSTIVSNSFSISGIPAGVNITEVRANVISYTIDDNFKGDCMKCVNFPFTWASTSTATNIATAPPKITMFGGVTVPSFNGSGAGAYQNPREVIWNNGTNLNSPNINNISMSFILPPTPNIDCCELKGKICVKFVFRNDKCEECEVIGCFDFVIKKK